MSDDQIKAYRVRNWTKFQHYKDRNPPWIKLHVELLNSADWVMLNDRDRLLMLVCMIVAAKHDGTVPNNPSYIKRLGYLKSAPNLTPLIECGFLENPQADASTMLALASTLQADARPEKEKRQSRAETEQKDSPSIPPLEDKPDERTGNGVDADSPNPQKPRGKASKIDVASYAWKLESHEYAVAHGCDPVVITDEIRDWAANVTPAKRLKASPEAFYRQWVRRANGHGHRGNGHFSQGGPRTNGPGPTGIMAAAARSLARRKERGDLP